MNNWTGIGNLVRDPEERVTPSGTVVVTFTVAVDDGFGDKKETDFVKVTVFGTQGENCAKYLSKGSKCGIVGRIHSGSYEKDGKKIYTTEVVAARIEFLGGKSDAAPGAEVKQDKLPAGMMYAEVDDIDIPFA